MSVTEETTPPSVERHAREIGRAGGHTPGPSLMLVAGVHGNEPSGIPAIRSVLRQLEGHRFRRQVPLGPFIADFACLAEKLVVELDGGQHAVDVDKDRRRDARFAERGYRVVRFWNDDVMRNTDAVLAEILGHLEDSRR